MCGATISKVGHDIKVIFTDDGTSYPGYEVQNVLTRSNRCWCTGYDLNVDFVAKTSVPTLITNVIIQNSGLVCIYIYIYILSP